MVKKNTDLESADKTPLLSSDEDETTRMMIDEDEPSDNVKEAVSAVPHTDLKEAGFWLFMLFIASVTMTVGNKVSICIAFEGTAVWMIGHVSSSQTWHLT